MTLKPDEFQASLTALGITYAAFARLMAVDDRTARRWALGEVAIPGCVQLMLTLLKVRPELVPVVQGLRSELSPDLPVKRKWKKAA